MEQLWSLLEGSRDRGCTPAPRRQGLWGEWCQLTPASPQTAALGQWLVLRKHLGNWGAAMGAELRGPAGAGGSFLQEVHLDLNRVLPSADWGWEVAPVTQVCWSR